MDECLVAIAGIRIKLALSIGQSVRYLGIQKASYLVLGVT